MTSRQKSWEIVAARMETLRSHVGKRVDQLSVSAAADREALEKSIHDMISALEDGFGAAGEAVRDARLRRDLAQLAEAVREALLATVGTAGEQLRGRIPQSIVKPKSITSVKTVKAAKPAVKRVGTVATRKPVSAKKAAGAKPTARKATAAR